MRCKKGFIRAFGKPFKKKLHEIVSKKFKLSRVEKRNLSILFNKIQFTPEPKEYVQKCIENLPLVTF